MAAELGQVEIQRQRLEDNVLKLQRSLHQWQTWEAEYDALRDEVNALPDDATADDIRRVAEEFGSTVIKRRDIEELIGTQQSIRRSRGQVAALITRRIDWVQQNCKSIGKQLQIAQADLSDQKTEENVPIASTTVPSTDIIEELDEHDNVISSRLAKPGEHADDIVKLLQNAGVTGETGSGRNATSAEQTDRPEGAAETLTTAQPELSNAEPRPEKSNGTTERVKPSKRSVTFADDVQEAEAAPTIAKASNEGVDANTDLKKMMKGTFGPDEKVWQVGDDDSPVDFYTPNAPPTESAEDAQLRRQMLEYNMQEVGAVVAELDLDDDESNSGFSSDDEEIDIDSTTDDDEEDQYGRSTKRLVSDEYREKMQALEQKLRAQMMHNVGPLDNSGDSTQLSSTTEMDSGLSSQSSTEGTDASSTRSKPKAVRFAAELDVAPKPSGQIDGVSQSASTAPGPISGNIVERTKDREATATSEAPRKVSKFKQARAAGTGREAMNTLSSDVVERPPREDSGSGPKKVSKFKAARSQQE